MYLPHSEVADTPFHIQGSIKPNKMPFVKYACCSDSPPESTTVLQNSKGSIGRYCLLTSHNSAPQTQEAVPAYLALHGSIVTTFLANTDMKTLKFALLWVIFEADYRDYTHQSTSVNQTI